MLLSLPRPYKYGIFTVIIIVAFSLAILYHIQTVTEDNLRSNLLNEQIDRQRNATKSLSQHVGSDLSLVITVLDGLKNSMYFQKDNIYTVEQRNSLIREKYALIDDIIDKLFVLDKNDVVTTSLSNTGMDKYLGADYSQREWVKEAKLDLKPVFSKGFERQGIFSIYIAIPVLSMEDGRYIGLMGASIPTERFFSRYGNVHDINTQFLVTFDKSGTILAVGADRNLVGKNFFGATVQQFIDHNEILNNLTRTLLKGSPANGMYDYGTTERINTGQPIFVENEAIYFLQIVTPTKLIISKISETLFKERLKSFSLFGAVFASVGSLIMFLLKWSKSMQKQVIKRTQALNRSNQKLSLVSNELSESNLSLQNANEQLRQHDLIQREFINIAAHELRTPIQPILGLTDVLRDNPSDSYQAKLLDIIMRNAKRLQRLSRDILDVSKIESNLLKLSKVQFNLNEKIESAISEIENDYDSNVRIIFQPKQSITIFADSERIYQVLTNLLSNAIKFTKIGTVTINISLNNSTNNNSEGVIVSIIDTGVGIRSEIMQCLFSKFVTTSNKGTGLGLFISKGIIEAHGGSIWAENNSNHVGARFSFMLPIA